MAIYRGPGGPGDATADQANTSQLAQTYASQAASSAANAATSASNASSSASAASTSASNASTSAAAAASSASNASTSATNASDSASAASVSATSAEAAQTATEILYDNFDDRYLGAKSSAPSVDNDGNALLTGALYFNSTSSDMYVYNGSSWVLVTGGGSGSGTVTSVAMTVPTGLSVTGSPITTNGTIAVTYSSGYAIPTTAKQTEWDTAYGWGNHASAGYLDSADIGVTVQGYSSVLQNTTASFTTADETKLDGIEAGADVTDATNVAASGAIMDGDFSTNGLMKRTGAGTYNVVTDNSSNWDTAYGWGNHASAGYLTSYTETDPIVGAINGIVKANGSGTISAAVAGTDYLTTAVTSATAGTGISVSSSTGSVTITNTAPDQTVSLTGSGATSISGTYPNFTISSTDTNTTYTAGTGLTLTGTTFSNTDLGSSQNIFKNIAVAGQSSIVADSNNDTLTIVAGTGVNLTTDATTDTLTITNSSPDQTVAISSGTGISVSGTYPNFTVAATNNGTVTSVGLSAPTGFSVANSPVTSSGTLALSFSSGYSLPTTTSQSNWDTAYGWGDHATQNYLDSADIGSTVQAYDSNLTSFVSAFTLPTTDGSNGQVLTTNGSGTLSFTTASGGGITTGKAIAMAIVFG